MQTTQRATARSQEISSRLAGVRVCAWYRVVQVSGTNLVHAVRLLHDTLQQDVVEVILLPSNLLNAFRVLDDRRILYDL